MNKINLYENQRQLKRKCSKIKQGTKLHRNSKAETEQDDR